MELLGQRRVVEVTLPSVGEVDDLLSHLPDLSLVVHVRSLGVEVDISEDNALLVIGHGAALGQVSVHGLVVSQTADREVLVQLASLGVAQLETNLGEVQDEVVVVERDEASLIALEEGEQELDFSVAWEAVSVVADVWDHATELADLEIVTIVLLGAEPSIDVVVDVLEVDLVLLLSQHVEGRVDGVSSNHGRNIPVFGEVGPRSAVLLTSLIDWSSNFALWGIEDEHAVEVEEELARVVERSVDKGEVEFESILNRLEELVLEQLLVQSGLDIVSGGLDGHVRELLQDLVLVPAVLVVQHPVHGFVIALEHD